jgi:hypothetical protein
VGVFVLFCLLSRHCAAPIGVIKPAVCAASAPLSFMVGTQQWEDTSCRCVGVLPGQAVEGSQLYEFVL